MAKLFEMKPIGAALNVLGCIAPNTTAGDMSYSRATTETRVDQFGNNVEVPASVPIISYEFESGCPELILKPNSTLLSQTAANFNSLEFVYLLNLQMIKQETTFQKMFIGSDGGQSKIQLQYISWADRILVNYVAGPGVEADILIPKELTEEHNEVKVGRSSSGDVIVLVNGIIMLVADNVTQAEPFGSWANSDPDLSNKMAANVKEISFDNDYSTLLNNYSSVAEVLENSKYIIQ